MIRYYEFIKYLPKHLLHYYNREKIKNIDYLEETEDTYINDFSVLGLEGRKFIFFIEDFDLENAHDFEIGRYGCVYFGYIKSFYDIDHSHIPFRDLVFYIRLPSGGNLEYYCLPIFQYYYISLIFNYLNNTINNMNDLSCSI